MPGREYSEHEYIVGMLTTPTTSGGTTVSGGGGGGGEAPITWSNKYSLDNAPGWWKGMMPSRWTAETEFAAMANALLPYMSAEDQRALGSTLSRLFPDAFSSYSPEQTDYPTPVTAIPETQQTYFQSQQRADEILSALNKMKEASGQDESKFGPGYQYLRHLAQTMKDFGAPTGAKNMSRRQIINLYGALDPLLAETKGEQLGAYGEVARSLTQPFFSAAGLLEVSKDESGKWTFGKANKSWF